MPFVLEAAMKSVFASTALRFAQLAHAKSAFVDNPAAIHKREGSAGDVQLLHRGLDEAFQLRDALGSERQRLPAGEGLFVVALGPEALDDQPEL